MKLTYGDMLGKLIEDGKVANKAAENRYQAQERRIAAMAKEITSLKRERD